MNAAPPSLQPAASIALDASSEGLRAGALAVLCEREVDMKLALAVALGRRAETFHVEPQGPRPQQQVPGRPDQPALVHPARVPRRSPAQSEGLAALVHAIAHIEFNAINLAADAAWRFDGMPREFHLDWVRVAAEEAHHFSLLAELLRQMGHTYGDFPAHDGLWSMCEKTAGDVVARMALVPRVLEARGLDATPQIQGKLRQVDSPHARRAVEVLDVILRDEVGHVAIGNHWYRWCCEQGGLDPAVQEVVVAQRYDAPGVHPPFNTEARRRAGFTEEELARLAV